MKGGAIMFFVIKKSVDGQFYFNIKADNGETLCHSENYTTMSNCIHAIDVIKNNCDKNSKVLDETE